MPFSGVVVVIRFVRISLRVRVGFDCFIRATIAARLGAADEVPEKLFNGVPLKEADWLVAVIGSGKVWETSPG